MKIARAGKCELIALTTHGHPFNPNLIYGSTISEVCHVKAVPCFLAKARRGQTVRRNP